MDYFDIFGENTTKLSTYEETYEPNLKLSTMLYESMLQSLDADIAITEAMIRSDVTEIRFRRANVNEAAIEALHEGVISKIWDAIVKAIKWLWDKVKSFFAMICNAIKNFFKKIGEMISRAFGGSNPENKKAIEEINKIQNQLNIPEDKKDSFEELKTKVENLSDEEKAKLCNANPSIKESMKNVVERELQSNGIKPEEAKNKDQAVAKIDREKEELRKQIEDLKERERNLIERETKLNNIPDWKQKIINLKPITGEDLKSIEHSRTYNIINYLKFRWKTRGVTNFNDKEYLAVVQWYESDLYINGNNKGVTNHFIGFAKKVLDTIQPIKLPKGNDGDLKTILTVVDNEQKFEKEYKFDEAKKMLSKARNKLSKVVSLPSNRFNTFRTADTIKIFGEKAIDEAREIFNLINAQKTKFDSETDNINLMYGKQSSIAPSSNPTGAKKDVINSGDSQLMVQTGMRIYGFQKATYEDFFPQIRKVVIKYRDEYMKICQEIEKEMKTRLNLFNKNITIMVNAKFNGKKQQNDRDKEFIKVRGSATRDIDIQDTRDLYNAMIYKDSAISFDDIDLNNQYLDEQFMLEMSEYEIEQIFENTYTDKYGRIVCNF